MPRRREVPKRRIIPDPKFKDKLVTKFTNTLMFDGKKATAEGILYGALDVIQERFKEDPLEVFRKALDNVKPKLEVKSRRVGGATYQVPVEVRPERRVALAMRWLVTYARDRGEKTMRERLAAEFFDAARPRQRREEEGRHAQDGRGQQGLRPLPLVSTALPHAARSSDPKERELDAMTMTSRHKDRVTPRLLRARAPTPPESPRDDPL